MRCSWQRFYLRSGRALETSIKIGLQQGIKQHSRILTHRSRHFFFSFCGNVLHQRVKSQRPNLKRAYCSFFAFLALYFTINVLTVGYFYKLQPWTKVLGHFCIMGCFPIPTGPTPPLTPQKKVGRVYLEQIQIFFPSFNFVQGGGREKLNNISKRMHFFYEGTQNREKNMNTALLSQECLSMIVPYSRYKFSSSSLKLPVTFPDIELNISRTCSLRKKGA